MKFLIFLIPFSLFGFSLPDGSRGISPITDINIVNPIYEGQCGKGPCSLIDLEFILMGCQDELGPIYVKVRKVEDRYIVFLNVLNIHMKQSDGVTCFLPKKEKRTLELPKEINRDNLYFSLLEEK